MEFDSAVLERVAQQFRREMWSSVVLDAIVEAGVEARSFGPVQATSFADLPEVGTLNQIQGAAEPGAIEDGHLAAAVEWMRSREVDYRIPVADRRPGSAEAEAWLGQRGYERAGAGVKFVRDASLPDFPEDPGVRVFELGDHEADGEGLSAIVAEAFGMPITAGALFFSLPMEERWRCFTASVASEEEIVATASMLIEDGVAQLGPGATLDRGRGRGCNRALLRRRLIAAAEAGCHTVFVELGECDADRFAAGRHILLAAGFEEAYASRIWQRPALKPSAVR